MSLSWFFRLILFAISYFNQWILHEKVCWKKVYIYILFKLKFDLLVNVKMEGLDWFCSKKVLKVSPFVKKKKKKQDIELCFCFIIFFLLFILLPKIKLMAKIWGPFGMLLERSSAQCPQFALPHSQKILYIFIVWEGKITLQELHSMLLWWAVTL